MIVEFGDFVGVEVLVGMWVVDVVEVVDGNVDLGIVVWVVGFQQQDVVGRVGGKLVGQQVVGRFGVNDEVVVGIQYFGYGEFCFVVFVMGCWICG